MIRFSIVVMLVLYFFSFATFQSTLGLFKSCGMLFIFSSFNIGFRHLPSLVQTQNLLFVQRFVLEQRLGNQLVLLTVRLDDMKRLFMTFIQDPLDFFINQGSRMF